MLDAIKKQMSGFMVNTNKTTALITIGLIVLFTATAVWFYRKYVVPSLDEDAYLENNEYRKGDMTHDNVIIYFFKTDWCPHCKKAEPIWATFEGEIGDHYKGRPVNFVKIDCEQDKKTADDFKVTSYPTIKLVYRNKTYEYDARPDVAALKKFLDTSISA